MYRIEKTTYGLRLTMGGLYSPDEVKNYTREKEEALAEIDSPLSILLDLRSAIPPVKKDESLLEESQEHLRQHNLVRMAVIVSSPVIKAQAKQISFNAKIADRTRFIDASKEPHWEELALRWIIDGTEPNGPKANDQKLAGHSKH